MDEKRRAYLRTYMRARRARERAGLDPAVGRGVVPKLTGLLPKRVKQTPTELPADADPGVYVLADGTRIRDRSRVQGRKRSENPKCEERADREDLTYRSSKTRNEVWHLDSGRMVPQVGAFASFCGIIPPLGSLVAVGSRPEEQTCKLCLRSMRSPRRHTGLSGEEYIARQEQLSQTQEALTEDRVFRRTNRATTRALLPDGREVTVGLVYETDRDRSVARLYAGEFDATFVAVGKPLRYAVGVPPCRIRRNGRGPWLWRARLDTAKGNERPIRYYKDRDEALA